MKDFETYKSRYSGKYSHKFWDLVNSTKGKDRDYLYSMGCALQSIEHHVLRCLNDVIKTERSK